MTKFTKYLILFFSVSLFLSSCAVLFNKDYTPVQIETEIPNTSVQVLPDSQVYQTPVKLAVMRSKSSLELRFRNDTMDTVFKVKSRIDKWVWANLYFYGFGVLVDLAHPRGRTYPAYVKLTPKGLVTLTNRQFRQQSWYQKEKGLFGVNLDWTFMNAQTAYDGSEYVTSGFPFFNFGIGMNYYFSEKNSVDISAGFANGTFGRYYEPNSRYNLYTQMHSFYYRASFQHDWRDFKLSAGLSLLQQYLRNPSDAMEFDPSGSFVQVINELESIALGPCVGFEWHAGEFITLGTHYMTGLYSFNTEPHWAYRDVVLALSLKLRIPLGASRRKDPRPRSYRILG